MLRSFNKTNLCKLKIRFLFIFLPFKQFIFTTSFLIKSSLVKRSLSFWINLLSLSSFNSLLYRINSLHWSTVSTSTDSSSRTLLSLSSGRFNLSIGFMVVEKAAENKNELCLVITQWSYLMLHIFSN